MWVSLEMTKLLHSKKMSKVGTKQVLVVTDFLSEELKTCTLYTYANWDVQQQTLSA
jgi:hypothetical protein